MAWKMSAAKRRALVKLQLRDKNGRWIEMGRGVKWYSSKRKKEIGGTVVGSQGNYALVRLNKENPTHEPALVKVPAHNIEVVSSKATLGGKPATESAPKSNLETPEFEQPEAVGRKSSNAFVKPSDNPEDYSISETPDGNTYISRKDGEQLYFPARSLDVGDTVIAPDGGDPTKPFSMGKAWAKKGAERLNTEGPKTGKVISIEGDRYAIVQLPEGHTVDDKKNPGEQTDKVTIGLSNSVIKLTPGLQAALGDKLNENFSDTSQNDGEEEEIDPASPDAQSDHEGRELTDEQYAEEDAEEDFQEPEEKPTKSVATVRGKALSELEFGIENMESDGVDPGLRVKGTKVEIYDYDDALRTVVGPLDVAQDKLDYDSDNMTSAERTDARSKIRGLSALRDFIEEEKENEAAAAEAPQGDQNSETSPEATSSPADAPEAPSATPEEEYNENGLTAEEQRTADALARMADKADEKGNFEQSDSLMAQYMELVKKGNERKKAPAPEEAPEAPAADEPTEAPTPALVEPTDPETPEDTQKFKDKPQLPPLEEGEELELPIPGVKKQGKRADKSAQHLKTLDKLEKGDRVSYTNAHDETFTYQKHEDGTWDLLDPEDEWEDQSPLEEALTADQVAQRHKRGDLEVSTVADQEEALREERYKNTDERGNDYFKNNPDAVRRPNNGDEGKSQTEQEKQDANSADKPWSVGEIQGTMRDWFDFAQAVKNGDNRAIETMANRKRTGDEETDIIVNDKGQPVDITLTYNDDGDPVVRLSNFDDSKDIYGDFEIDASVMPKHLATLIHESINADDIRAAVTERNGSADRELDKREAEAEAAEAESEEDARLTERDAEEHQLAKEEAAADAEAAEAPALNGEEGFTPIDGRGLKTSVNDWKDSLDDIMGILSDPDLAKAGNRITAGIQKLNGLDGPPSVVTSREEFDALPGKKLFRGVSKEAEAEMFVSGPNWVGSGGSGSGIYTSTNKFRGESFKRADGGALMEMKLPEDAKIADALTLEEERKRDLEKAIEENDTVAQFLADGDLGKYAASRGLDGYSFKPFDAYDEDEEFIALTNRGAVTVLGNPVESAEDVPEEIEETTTPNEGQDGPEPATPEAGPSVPESSDVDGGSDNDPTPGDEEGSGAGEGTGAGRTLTQDEIDSLPDDAVIVNDEGETLAKNDEGEWYSIDHFLETGDKDGLPSDMLEGRVSLTGDKKYGEDEFVTAVNHYIKNSFKSVNDYIRNGNDSEAGTPGFTDRVIDIMDDAIANSPLPEDTTFYRGLQINAAEAEKFVAGSIISDKGFTSVSADPDIAGSFAYQSSRLTGIPGPDDAVPVVLEVNLPKGHPALAIDYSKIENESWSSQQESVLARGSAFKVDSVEVTDDMGRKFYTLKVSPAGETSESSELDENGLTPDEQRQLEIAREEANLGGQVDSSPESSEAYQRAIDDILEIGRRRLAGEDVDSTPEAVSDTVEEESEWVNPLDAMDIVRRKPMAIDGETYPPTQQQQDVIDAVLAGLDTKVQAMAGTGKTSTLVALSRRIKEHGKQAIYIAFNKTVQEEAEKRMKGLPVEAKTGHGVAYQWALKQAPYLIARLNGKDPTRPIKFKKNGEATDWADKWSHTSSRDIASDLGIKNGDVKDSENQPLKYQTTVLAVRKTVEKFALSDKDEVGTEHVPEEFNIHEDYHEEVVRLAKEYWKDLESETGNFRVTHDVYRKFWALSRPDLTNGTGGNKKGANILYIDEAQDTPPVLAKVVADQNMQKVIVGDPNQAIYAFAENIDYLSEADGDVELPLNKSWRFGPQVADIGNRFLQFLGSNDRVVGGGGESSIVYGMEDADAVLVRTNAGMLDAIMDELKRGRRVTAPDGTRADLEKMIRSVEGLKDGNPLDYPHDDLVGFKDWGEVLNAYSNGDKNVSKIVKLFEVTDAYTLARAEPGDITRMNADKMEKAKKAVKNLVQYVPKFETLKIEEVSTGDGTRTYVSGVDVHPDPTKKWGPNEKYWATKNFSSELGKVLAPQAFNKSLSWGEQQEAYAKAGGLETLGFQWDSRAKKLYTDDPEAAAMLKSFSGEADVTISTAHKSKGLEWDRVRIGDDFFVPYEDSKTGAMVYPEDPAEYKLGYVAVTRAAKELDPGVLGWIYGETSENGGKPGQKKAPEAVEAPESTEESAPEVSVPEDSTPAPEQAAEEAPIEATPDTDESLEAAPESSPYDEDGLTPTEAARVAELDQQMADIYSGKSDAALKPVEDEWNDILAHGERRKKGEDLPEFEKPVDEEVAPEPVVEEAPEPEVIPEPVVEPTPAPAPAPAPAPEVAPEPEYDAEGLTPEERRRVDALEQAIYDAYRARKPETAKHLDTELNEILARGAARLKRKRNPEPETVEDAPKPKRSRKDYSGVPVMDANGTEIKMGDTIGHKRLGPVVVTGFLPAAGRVTYIDPSTNKQASVKASGVSIISADAATAPEAAPTTGTPGERFTDLTTGKEAFYGANGEPIIVGQRVTTADGRSGLVKSVYTAKSGVAWIPVQWDDTGKVTRVYGNLLSLEGGPDNGNGGGGSPEPEAPEPSAPEAPVEPEVPATPSVPATAPSLSIVESVEDYSGTEGFASSYDPETFSGNPLSAAGIRRFEERLEEFSGIRRDMISGYSTGADGSTLTHGVKVWNSNSGEYIGLIQSVENYSDETLVRIYKPSKQIEAEKSSPGHDPEFYSSAGVWDPSELVSKPPTQWDGSYVDFSQEASVADINAKLFQHYPSVHFNISENLQLAQAKAIAKAISANFRKFPMLETSMNDVSTQKPDDGAVASLASLNPDAAVFSDQHLNVNPYSAADFKEVVNKNRGGWFNEVPNGKQVDYIITHEMGHALDGLTGWTGTGRVYALLREWVDTADGPYKGMAYDLTNAELAKHLVNNKMISEYSAEMWNQGIDPDEMVAEAFADVEINGMKAKPVNKMIHKELMTRLEGMMQG